MPSSTKHCLFRLLEKEKSFLSSLTERENVPSFSFSRPHLLSLAFALGLVPPISHIPFLLSRSITAERRREAGRARGREGSFRSAPLWNVSTDMHDRRGQKNKEQKTRSNPPVVKRRSRSRCPPRGGGPGGGAEAGGGRTREPGPEEPAPEREEAPSRRPSRMALPHPRELHPTIARESAPRRSITRLRWPRAVERQGLRARERARERARRRRRGELRDECPRRLRPSSLRGQKRVFAQQRRASRSAWRCSCAA